MEYSIGFAPLIPPLMLIAACCVVLLLGLLILYRGLRGGWFRIVALGLLTLALAGPSLIQEDRERLKTIIALVVDSSESQSIDGRRKQTELAKNALRGRLENIDDFELRVVEVGPSFSSEADDVSTALIGALQSALEDVPPSRIGGAILVSDGQIHDVPELLENSPLGGTYPVHALITGHGEEKDRRLKLEVAPRFGIVGESQQLTYRVEDSGAGTRNGEEVFVKVLIDGELIAEEYTLVGEESEFYFDVPHAGKIIIELVTEPLEGELTEINNSVIAEMDGIRENLRVLLVSGEPHAGERTWRNLLKSDASVDLVHFTILRPPQKQDGTPIEELSLIAFPTRELFVEKIEEFDLIIFDRYQRRGVLPGLYFTYMADYVRAGGAILLAAGPEFAGLRSIASTALADILPALPTGDVASDPYRPVVTAEGQRHPVTRNLQGANIGENPPSWGRWFRRIETANINGPVLLSEGNDRPVLALRKSEEGRVGLFLSDHPWLWARDFDGGGPHVQLLRRISHWLMKEPELDEEALTAEMKGNTLVVRRQTMGEDPGPVSILLPDGENLAAPMQRIGDGQWTYEIKKPSLGLYEFGNGDLRALAHAGPQNASEFREILSTSEIVKPLVESRTGAVLRLALTQGAPMELPRIVPVRQGTRTLGNGWIGLERTGATRLVGLSRLPLFAGFIGLAIILAALSSLWYREGR